MSEKDEALRLADWHESVRLVGVEEECWKAAAELRRLHAENEALRRDAEKWRKAQAKYIAWQKGGKAEAMEET